MMTDESSTSKAPRNSRRTWNAKLYGDWGDGSSATVFLGSHTVSVSADADGQLSAEIDGEAQPDLERAVWMIRNARAAGQLTLLEATDAPESIGKARARTLHQIMGKLGLPQAQHYRLAAAALGEGVPLPSLADLSEREAKCVWGQLCRLYPQARDLARVH